MTAPNTRTQFSPTTATVRDLRPVDGSPKRAHEVLPPEAGIASTVRVREDRWGSHYFAKIGDHVFTWSPIQGAWVRPLA